LAYVRLQIILSLRNTNTRAAVVHTAETSTREATVVKDRATIRIKDAEDQVTLAEREALERVSRAEEENTTMLASAHEDAKGLAWKVTLLEDNLAVEGRAGKRLRGSTEHTSRSSPSCRLGALSYVMPASVLLG
jgi:hypothetical protein